MTITERIKKWSQMETVRIAFYFWAIILFALGVFFTMRFLSIDETDVRQWAESFGPFGWIFLLLATTASVIFSPLSAWTFIGVTVLMYNAWTGYFVGLAGGLIGGTVDYWLANKYGKIFIKKFIGPKTLKAVEEQGEKIKSKGVWTLFAIMPFSVDLTSYAAGLVGFPKKQFGIALAFGVFTNTLLLILLSLGVIELL